MSISSFTQQHALQPYWDLAYAPVQADAIAAALELGLFDALADAHSAAELAAQLSLHAPHTALLLELLWSMQLLERDLGQEASPRYRCSATTLQYYCRSSPAFCGDAWLYRLHAMRHLAPLASEGG
ncbi:methyltransferase family protein [Janthinobacterium aquaticum]|uniref:methyltransferase family protein n=1 Tax=Janthinobacterium sp. FT58W TaxID=2654254 RepID=UPI00186AF966|nr:methyltransferase dimerization domain-containing protein [Janthinobacterium sp. FT58W]